MWGALAGAIGLDAISNLINWNQQKKQAEGERNMQMEFAKHGIQWKLEDAKRMGISPLAALGANGSTYNPIQVGGGPVSENMGQDLTRAYLATRTPVQKEDLFTKSLKEFQLKKAGYDAEEARYRSIIARTQANQTGPGIPIPDTQTFIDKDGRTYTMPSAEWAQVNQVDPFTRMGFALKNNIVPAFSALDRIAEGNLRYDKGNYDWAHREDYRRRKRGW